MEYKLPVRVGDMLSVLSNILDSSIEGVGAEGFCLVVGSVLEQTLCRRLSCLTRSRK